MLMYPLGLTKDQEQIEDLKQQSLEYEKQQTIRLSNRSARGEVQTEEPFINEPIIVGPPRRQTSEYTSGSQPYRSRHSYDHRPQYR